MNLKQSKILIISDIHGNAEGLKAVLKKEHKDENLSAMLYI